MVRVVIFDLGNVILPVDGNRLAKKLKIDSDLIEDKLLDYIQKEMIISGFESGHVNPKSFYLKVVQDLGLVRFTFEKFVEVFNDIFDEDQAVIDLLHQLKGKYKLGMISNTNTIHAEFLKSQYDLFNHFDSLIFSHEVGLRKPDPAIYHLALKSLQAQPHETVFIDDLLTNVQGAIQVGMKGIHFKTAETLKNDLHQLGVAA